MATTHPKPGFRFSPTDAAVLIVGALLTCLSWRFIGSFALIFAIVLVHSFLFCNVFRVRRRYELIWAGIFIVNVLLCSMLGEWNWWPVLTLQFPFTLGAILLEVRSERYHGFGYSLKRSDSSAPKVFL